MICELDMLPQIILATMDYEDFDSTVTRRAFVTKLDDKQHLWISLYKSKRLTG